MPNPNISIQQKTGQSFTTGTNGTGQVPYYITGTTDPVEVVQAIAGVAPPNVTQGGINYTLDGITFDEEYIGSGTTAGVWSGTANYRNREIGPGNAGDPPSYNFTTGGGTQHITTSKATASTALFGTAPNFGNAIGVTPGGVEGVDIGVREFEWTETHYFTDDQVTVSFLRAIWLATFTTNSVAVNHPKVGTLAIGELLFKGGDLVKRGNGQWEGTFRFAASPNVTNLSVGAMAGIHKTGWEYLWVYYRETEDTAAKLLAQTPIYVFTETVYDATNHNALGIFNA
jgi:hypothetical protein